jgi:pimeloyl-ACP methyl ester carboxylesterase
VDLADWDYRDDILGGITFAHWSRGRGNPVVAVHGVGPGTTAYLGFAPVLDALVARHEVHLIDLIGFGRSGRKPHEPYFDVELWVRQISQVVAALSSGPVALLGASIGGALALKAAARHPAVRTVIAVGSPAERYPIPVVQQRFWSVPRSLEDLAESIRPMTAAQAPPAPSVVTARFAPFADAAYGEYFGRMLPGTKQAELDRAAVSDDEARRIAASVLLLHGRDDRAVPPELTALPLSRRLPNADLVLLAACGHNVLWERTDMALALILETLAKTMEAPVATRRQGAEAPVAS